MIALDVDKLPSEMMNDCCPLCLTKGTKSRLETFQINLTEAIVMCPIKQCPYPLACGRPTTELLLQRDFTHPDVLKKKPVISKQSSQIVPTVTQIHHSNCSAPQDTFHNSNTTNLVQSKSVGLVNDKSNTSQKSHDLNLKQEKYMKSCSRSSLTVPDSLSNSTVNDHVFSLSVPKNNNLSQNISNNFNGVSKNVPLNDNSVTKISSPFNKYKRKQYLQWINRDAMCWLDVSMCLILHCASFCKLLQNCSRKFSDSPPSGIVQHQKYDRTVNIDTLQKYETSQSNPTSVGHSPVHLLSEKFLLSELYQIYCYSRDSLRQAIDFKRCAQSAREGRFTTIQMSIGRIIVKTGGGGNSVSSLGILTSDFDTTLKSHDTNQATIESNALTQSPSKPGIVKPHSILKNSPRKASTSLCQKEWIMTSQELDERAEALISKAKTKMEEMRIRMWTSLQPALKCEFGKNDSPVFAIPILLKENALFEEFFTLRYYWQMDCTKCGYHHIDRQIRPLPSFPAVPLDFCMLVPYFLRPCFQCEEPEQRLTLIYQHLPTAIIAHFVEGLHEDCLRNYDFIYGGCVYAVKGVVQYINNPDHFVAWIRDPMSKSCNERDF